MDEFENRADGLSAPARRAWSVDPEDGSPLERLPKALWVGSGGNVVLRAVGDMADVTFANVPSGTLLPVRASHVRATGTTAQSIVALG